MMKKYLLILACVFLLTNCSVFSPVKPDDATNYMIQTVPQVKVKKASRKIALFVAYPETNPVYNTISMAYTAHPYQLAYFAKNRWGATPAQMLQPLIVQTLQNTHYFRVVSSSRVAGRYDYILNTQIVLLEQNFLYPQSQLHLKLRAQLLSTLSNQVIASKEFYVIEPAPQNTPYGGVIAANRAAAKILEQLARFCVQKT